MRCENSGVSGRGQGNGPHRHGTGRSAYRLPARWGRFLALMLALLVIAGTNDVRAASENVDIQEPGDYFWNTVKDSQSADDFDLYTFAYPQGRFVLEAKKRAEQLRAANPEPQTSEPVVSEMDAQFEVSALATVRKTPEPTGAYLQMLNPGDTVTVTGKVLDASWYRVESGDGTVGFVAGESVTPVVVPEQVRTPEPAEPVTPESERAATGEVASAQSTLPGAATAVTDTGGHAGAEVAPAAQPQTPALQASPLEATGGDGLVRADVAPGSESTPPAVAATAPAQAIDSRPASPLTPEAAGRLEALLRAAEQDIRANRLTVPEGANAFMRLEEARALAPDDARIAQGMLDIVERYAVLIRSAAARGSVARATSYLERARGVMPESALLDTLRAELESR